MKHRKPGRPKGAKTTTPATNPEVIRLALETTALRGQVLALRAMNEQLKQLAHDRLQRMHGLMDALRAMASPIVPPGTREPV